MQLIKAHISVLSLHVSHVIITNAAFLPFYIVLKCGKTMRYGIPSLHALQAFEATARLGSFSRAAEELSLSHSAIYRQVSGLEEALGVQLLTRIRRRLALTDAGKEYAGRIRRHLDQLEKDTLSVMVRASMGRSIHLAVLPTLATHWLMPHLQRFHLEHPDITVNLSIRTLHFQFRDHPFDAAIYHAMQFWPNTSGIKLFDEHALVPVVTPAAWEQAKHHAEQLTHLHMMSRPMAWRHWYQSQGIEYSPLLDAGPRYELFSLTLAAVHAGLGIGLIPLFLVENELKKGSLIMPFNHSLHVRESYYFSYPADSAKQEALQLLESWLAKAAIDTQTTAFTLSKADHKQ